MRQDIDVNGVHERWRPKLRLFLSADIVGSTALKQPFDLSLDNPQKVNSWDHWSRIIEFFYTEIDEQFRAECQKLVEELEAATSLSGEEVAAKFFGERQEFWKTVGDEVLYWKDLNNEYELWFTLSAWIAAISVARRSLRKLGADRGALLDIKCTAWIAGFPVRNKAIQARKSRTHQQVSRGSERGASQSELIGEIDFIGPAIDVGFRVSQWSSSSRFYVSLDVAYLLAISYLNADVRARFESIVDSHQGQVIKERVRRIKVNFGGTEFLKGVLGGSKYPRLWISNPFPGSLDEIEEDIFCKGQTEHWALLVSTYCRQFYKERSKYLSPPFINDPSAITYSDMHPGYPAAYAAAVEAHKDRDVGG